MMYIVYYKYHMNEMKYLFHLVFRVFLIDKVTIFVQNISEVSVVKKSGSEPAPKRTRNETPSTLPAFKVQ